MLYEVSALPKVIGQEELGIVRVVRFCIKALKKALLAEDIVPYAMSISIRNFTELSP